MLWQGCRSWSMPLMTGTVDHAASSLTVSLSLERISMAALYWLRVRAVSAMLSRPGRWISPGRRYSALPPSSAKPFSKLTRVRVEAASKIIARCLPGRKGVSGRFFQSALRFTASLSRSSSSSRV